MQAAAAACLRGQLAARGASDAAGAGGQVLAVGAVASRFTRLVPASVKDPDRWLVHRCIQYDATDNNIDDSLGACPMREPRNHRFTAIDLSEVMLLFW